MTGDPGATALLTARPGGTPLGADRPVQSRQEAVAACALAAGAVVYSALVVIEPDEVEPGTALGDRDTGGTWRQDFTTTADGIILTYTPKPGYHDEFGMPPVFDLSSANDDDAALVRSLGDIRDYGGDLTLDARYLIAPHDDATPSIADILGATGPGEQIVLSAGGTSMHPASTFQLAVVTETGAVRDRIALHPRPSQYRAPRRPDHPARRRRRVHRQPEDRTTRTRRRDHHRPHQ
ncbi:hypothetical protein [Actinoplanes awajinensis]|uniref:Uncharacterized protein n=1 Tax=Actinoplanes awajinensis subsp. mycoplanecinus TaxID=135947 RepID=A0A0X3VBG1_9ACTN|nr:hypothetical protein [Actinoplanes awajinensis]KUL42075.1 hypothetical protein ADL15_02265 [Actinoplanes awajinensis subsp. mycoplanecinus]